MFYDDVSGLVRVLVVAPLAYVWLIIVLRVSGKRTLVQLNAFDFVVTVALGSTLASVALTKSVAWAEGALALALLASLQLIAALAAVHSSRARDFITSKPTVLLLDGRVIPAALGSERISQRSLHQAVRNAGIGGLELVAAVVLETNGQLKRFCSGSIRIGGSPTMS